MFVNLDLGPFQVTCYCLRCFIFTPYEKFGKFNTISDKGRVCTMELMDTSDPLEGGGGGRHSKAGISGMQCFPSKILPSGLCAELCCNRGKTSQELRMLSSVTINCQVTKIVMNSGSQLSEL